MTFAQHALRPARVGVKDQLEGRSAEQWKPSAEADLSSIPEPAQSEVHPGCQQSASNPASHSLASHLLAIEASPVYLRRCDVKAGHAWR